MSSVRQQRRDEVVGDRFLDRAAFGRAAQCNVLLAGRAPQDAALLVERVIVRDDEAGHDGFAQAPGGLDDALVRRRSPGSS